MKNINHLINSPYIPRDKFNDLIEKSVREDLLRFSDNQYPDESNVPYLCALFLIALIEGKMAEIHDSFSISKMFESIDLKSEEVELEILNIIYYRHNFEQHGCDDPFVGLSFYQKIESFMEIEELKNDLSLYLKDRNLFRLLAIIL